MMMQDLTKPSQDSAETVLRADDLKVAIHGQPVLRGLDFQIAEGEVLALTGESGSGKSMTALAAMGLLPEGAEASGTLMLGWQGLLGQDERTLSRIRGREIAMIFQEPMTALNPLQTIGRQVSETIRIHRPDISRRETRDMAARTLTRVGLPQDRFPLSRYPHELSGGQRQRVGIALAIALRPKLLIADEPTTALDVTTQAQILELLQNLVREDGMALMMITHDLAVVAQMADRIAVMHKGEIVETGATADLLRARSHPYTQSLFDASRHRADLPPADPGAPLLRVQNAQRHYPLPRPHPFAPRASYHAVRDVSFEIRKGERVGLVGESGCGKSTLTRAILGLESLQGGTITLDGEPVSTTALRRRMQVVFQDPFGSFNPRHRVARLITEPFHLLDNPPQGQARRDAIAAALNAVGLTPEDADKHIHAFSGGQRQRLAIARALILRPELIVFDEAVSALDVRVRAQILDLIAELAREHGLAYLFISHDLSVVHSVTDRVMVMQAGEIVEEGPTDAVFEQPRHAYTRRLLDAAPRLPDL